jgi:hypothetical protein
MMTQRDRGAPWYQRRMMGHNARPRRQVAGPSPNRGLGAQIATCGFSEAWDGSIGSGFPVFWMIDATGLKVHGAGAACRGRDRVRALPPVPRLHPSRRSSRDDR